MTVDGQDSGNTVIRLLNKKHRRNKENVQPEFSRARTSAEPPAQRHILNDVTNRTSKVNQRSEQMNILEEVQAEI